MNNIINATASILATLAVLYPIYYSLTNYEQNKPRNSKTGRYTKKLTLKPARPSKPKKRTVPVYDCGVFAYNIKL